MYVSAWCQGSITQTMSTKGETRNVWRFSGYVHISNIKSCAMCAQCPMPKLIYIKIDVCNQ